MKRKQKLVAATITCLFVKAFREKVRSLYSPERYYFRGERTKSVKKSDPSIFYYRCNLTKFWIFRIIGHKIINPSAPSLPKFKNKRKTKTKINSSDYHLWRKDVYKAFRVFLFPLNDIILAEIEQKPLRKVICKFFSSSFSNSWSISHEKKIHFSL